MEEKKQDNLVDITQTIFDPYKTIVFDLDGVIWDCYQPNGQGTGAFTALAPFKREAGNIVVATNGVVIRLQEGVDKLIKSLDRAGKNLGIVSRSEATGLTFAAQPSVMLLKSFGLYDYFNYDVIIKTGIEKSQYVKPNGKTLFIDDNPQNLQTVNQKDQVDTLNRKSFGPWEQALVPKQSSLSFGILKEAWEEPELNEEQKAKANILYAIYSAEAVLPIYENKYPNDNRPRLAIEAAKTVLKYPTEENKAKARAAWAAWAAWAAADAANAAYASARAASGAADAADAADAAYASAIKYAKKAAKEANIDIDFDSLLYKAQSDIWEYINISEANNTSEASKASLKLAWEEWEPVLGDKVLIDLNTFGKADRDFVKEHFPDLKAQIVDFSSSNPTDLVLDNLNYRKGYNKGVRIYVRPDQVSLLSSKK